MGFFSFFENKGKPPKEPLTAFAEYLVDNPEVKNKVISLGEKYNKVLAYGDISDIDARENTEGDRVVRVVLERAGVTLPEGVSAIQFAGDLVHKIADRKYIPTWQEDNIENSAEENTPITSIEALKTLLNENSTVEAAFKKVKYESLEDIESFKTSLNEAGYITDLSFPELVQELLASELDQVA